jgi:hypothetical protein
MNEKQNDDEPQNVIVSWQQMKKKTTMSPTRRHFMLQHMKKTN